jgi:hypothetical protein
MLRLHRVGMAFELHEHPRCCDVPPEACLGEPGRLRLSQTAFYLLNGLGGMVVGGRDLAHGFRRHSPRGKKRKKTEQQKTKKTAAKDHASIIGHLGGF